MGQHCHHGIDYIEFSVDDLARAKQFYASAFGWRLTDYGPSYVGIAGPPGYEGPEMGGITVGEVASGGPLVVLFSADLEASVRAVEAAGGEVVKVPFDFPGGRRFHFRDPAGNELAIWAEAAKG